MGLTESLVSPFAPRGKYFRRHIEAEHGGGLELRRMSRGFEAEAGQDLAVTIMPFLE
jgi:hypothetical protein